MPQDSDTTPPSRPPRQGRCPRCGKIYQYTSVAQHKTFPFCSARCRETDLGNWITGRYAIPGQPLPPEPADEEGGAD